MAATEASQAPRFATAQQLAAAIGSHVRFAEDAERGPVLFVDVSLRHLFDAVRLPVKFDLDLGPLNAIDAAADAELAAEVDLAANFELGVALRKPGVDFVMNRLADFNRGMGVQTSTGSDIRITLRDASFSALEVDLSGLTTASQVKAAIEAAAPGVLEVVIDQTEKRFILVDHSEGDNRVFRVERVGDSLAAFGLGIAGTSDAGRIEGAAVHGETLTDLMFLRQQDQPLVTATTRLLAGGVDASARLGLVELGIDGGSIAGQLTATIDAADFGEVNQFTNQLTLREALEAISGGLVRPSVRGSADLDLPLALEFAGLDVEGLIAPQTPRLTATIADLTRTDFSGPGGVEFDFSAMGNVANLRDLSFDDVLTALQGGLEYLTQLESSEDVAFMNEELPLLGIRLGDVVGVAARFATIVEAMEGSGAGGLAEINQRLAEAIGDAGTIQLGLDVVGDEAALRIDLSQSFDLLDQRAPLKVDLDSLNVPGLSELVDLAGQAEVDLEVGATVALALGLDLTHSEGVKPFLYDVVSDGQGGFTGSRVEISARAAANDLEFVAAAGPLGVEVNAGTLLLGNGSGPARFAVGLKNDDANGRHYLDELAAQFGGASGSRLTIADLDLSTIGQAQAVLPVAFRGLPFSDTVTVSLNDLLDFSAVDVDGGSVFDTAYAALSGDFDLSAMVGGFNGAFDLLIDAMNGQLFGAQLPLIGDALKDEARFLVDLKNSVSENLEQSLDSAASGVQAAIYDALGPGGLNVLRDINSPADNNVADGAVTLADVINRPDPSGDGRYFRIEVGSDPIAIQLPAGFDLGVPGLALDINAPLSAELGYNLALGMGVNLTDGFYLDTSDPSELEVFLDVTAPGLSAEGELGILRVLATDRPTAQATVGLAGSVHSRFVLTGTRPGDELAGVQVRFVNNPSLPPGGESAAYNTNAKTLTFTINSSGTTANRLIDLVNNHPTINQDFTADRPFAGSGNGLINPNTTATTVADLPARFTGDFTVDLVDPSGEGRLSLAEMLAVEEFSDVVDITADARADVDLHLLADFGASAAFPAIRTDLSLDWQYDLDAGASSPEVSFENVELNLGDFFRQFAAQSLDQVQQTLEPVQPIIDTLRTPVPVISDLMGGDVNFLELARMFGGKFAQAARFINAAATVVDTIQAIPDLGSETWVSFGDANFNLATGLLEPVGGSAPTLDATSLAQMAGLSTQDASRFLRSSTQADPDGLTLSFPILSDPSRLFALLTGNDVDLFTVEFPTLEFEVAFSQFFPVPPIPILGAQLTASVGARVDFAFGYDTVGINEFRSSGNPLDVFNGFYLFDHENADGTGADISEVIFNASVTAGLGVNLGVVSGSVDGGLFGQIDFDLHDNNEDGRIRAIELLDNILLGPIHIFDVSGAVDARLIASASVLGVEVEADIVPPIRLLDFEIDRPDEQVVQLAQFAPGTGRLELNIGPDAGRRNLFFTEDVAENYLVRPGSEPGAVIVEAFGRSQEYFGVTSITGDAGLGDDRITIAEALNIPVVLRGGDGNDTLIGGGAADQLFGDAGDDELFGGGGNDRLEGGQGRDALRGGDESDTLLGGDQQDELYGQEGNDVLEGQLGDDRLLGGGGEDILRGGDGDDFLEGGAGSDVLEGGRGNDQLDGGRDGDVLRGDDGNDTIVGGRGADEIYGGRGDDTVFGGLGNDEIHGGDGNDRLFGENSRDTIYGDRGNDTIEGGLAADILYGGLGNDILYASDAAQTPEFTSHTLYGGGGDDVLYAALGDDTVFGDGHNDEETATDPRDDGDDTIYAFDGDDVVYAGGGDDVVQGGLGNDFVAGGQGDDQLQGGGDDDTLWGGDAAFAETFFDRRVAANFTLPPDWEITSSDPLTATSPRPSTSRLPSSRAVP